MWVSKSETKEGKVVQAGELLHSAVTSFSMFAWL